MASETIFFGSGCFWCTEAVFSMIEGVKSTYPGYAGGTTSSPTYEQVCSGTTGHAEVLKIEYDPSKVTLERLLEIMFRMHDPTSLNKQGADEGTQYRSIILYDTNEQKDVIEKFISKVRGDFAKTIVTEVKKLDKFYPAEEYHHNYFKKNPNQGYCSAVIRPKVDKIKKEFEIK